MTNLNYLKSHQYKRTRLMWLMIKLYHIGEHGLPIKSIVLTANGKFVKWDAATGEVGTIKEIR